jgi:formylglycine-generating enzyme required for sulfatase activity/uncharacterized caspase-like protein
MHGLTAFHWLCLSLAFSILLARAAAETRTAAEPRAKGRSGASTARTPEAPPARGVQVVSIRDRTGQQVGLYTASYALVIGASAYTHWPLLPGVQQDVREVTAVLQAQGFHVELVRDPTRDALQRAFESFIARYGQQENHRLLIYFAGHGHTMKQAYGAEMGYLVPIDAPLPQRDEAGFRAQALDMHLIENYARRIQAKHVLFLFDSCFSGSVFSLSRAIPEYIQYKTSEPVRQFITSGSANEQVPDVSIFRQQLVAGLRGEADVDGDGYVTGAELGEFLQKRVVNYSNNTQQPQYGKLRDPYLDKGDFVFLVSPSPLPSPSPSVSDLQAQLAAERQRLEEERRRLDEQRRLQEEVQKLQAEQERLRLERGKLQGGGAPPGQRVAVGVYPQQPPEAPKTLRNSIGMEFVPIPAGTFQMGSNDWDARDDEKPVHRVHITQPFYLGKYEVTQGQWLVVMGTNLSKFAGDPNLPVESVSWDDVQEFIRRLNNQAGGTTYRLPTEAEWEYAARAGTTTRWSFGDDANQLGRYAWYEGNAGRRTHPVVQLQPNAWGLYDMYGNVWEWVQDWYGKYASDAAVDPAGPSTGSSRVIRGGCWLWLNQCRSASRGRRRHRLPPPEGGPVTLCTFTPGVDG